MVIKKKFNIYYLVFFAIILPLFILIILSSSSIIYSIDFISSNEVLSNLSSFLIVSFIWMVFYNKLNEFVDKNTLNIITCLLFVKILINFLYIYHFQLPILGYESSNEFEISKSGDSGLAHLSILKLIKDAPDLFQSLLANVNYYNNKGTLIIYSLIYQSFGNFPTNSIPWDSLVVGIYTIIFYMIAGFIDTDKKNTLVPIYIFTLPALFLTPLLYRDVYIILLLSISIFIIFYKNDNNIYFQKFLILVFIGFILFFFRKFYSLLPITFFVIYLIVHNIKLRKIIVIISITLITILSIYTYINFELIFTDSAHTSLQKGYVDLNSFLAFLQDAQLKIIHGERSGGEFVTLLEKQNYFIKIFLRFFFFLVSPFPWFKSEFDTNSIYSLFISLQVFISFMLYFHVINIIISKQLNKNFFILIVYFLLICFLAVLGALQYTHYYIMAGIPILALTLITINLKYLKKYFLYSLYSGLLLHIIHFISKKFLF